MNAEFPAKICLGLVDVNAIIELPATVVFVVLASVKYP